MEIAYKNNKMKDLKIFLIVFFIYSAYPPYAEMYFL